MGNNKLSARATRRNSYDSLLLMLENKPMQLECKPIVTFHTLMMENKVNKYEQNRINKKNNFGPK